MTGRREPQKLSLWSSHVTVYKKSMYQQERWSRFSYRIRGRVIRAVIRIGLFIRGFRLRLTAVIRCRGCPDTYMAGGCVRTRRRRQMGLRVLSASVSAALSFRRREGLKVNNRTVTSCKITLLMLKYCSQQVRYTELDHQLFWPL